MNIRRTGLAGAVLALSTLSACSMWQGMTDRITGRGGASDTATSSGAMPGVDTSRLRGPTVPAVSADGMPTFRSYNECRAWLARQGRQTDRGPLYSGEASIVDVDPCRSIPRS